MKEKPIAVKIEFVYKIINATENKVTQRYYNDIIGYINELKHDNDKMYEANIILQNQINELKEKIKEPKE